MAFELRLILEERMRGMAFLKAINAKLEELYAEDEGDGEGEGEGEDEDEGESELDVDELVEDLVDDHLGDRS